MLILVLVPVKGQVPKFMRSCRQYYACLPVNCQLKVAEIPKLAGRLSVPRLILLRTRFKVKRSNDMCVCLTCLINITYLLTYVKVTRPLNPLTENQSYLRNGKVYELQTWYRYGIRWPTCVVTSKLKALWVAVQVTICRGRGHNVAAPLQAT